MLQVFTKIYKLSLVEKYFKFESEIPDQPTVHKRDFVANRFRTASTEYLPSFVI